MPWSRTREEAGAARWKWWRFHGHTAAMTVEPKNEKALATLLDLARGMLAGKILGLRAGIADRDQDLMKFLVIDSETEALPIGKMRELWDPDALERLQPEIARAEAWAKKVGTPACRNLIRRFGGAAA